MNLKMRENMYDEREKHEYFKQNDHLRRNTGINKYHENSCHCSKKISLERVSLHKIFEEGGLRNKLIICYLFAWTILNQNMIL